MSAVRVRVIDARVAGRHKPRKSGATFCAPSCGRGCTLSEYRAAKDNARKLAADLGVGWHGVVWENMGWHYKAVNLRASLDVYGAENQRHYWCTTVGTNPQHAAKGFTPRAAVRRLVNAVQIQARRVRFALRTTAIA